MCVARFLGLIATTRKWMVYFWYVELGTSDLVWVRTNFTEISLHASLGDVLSYFCLILDVTWNFLAQHRKVFLLLLVWSLDFGRSSCVVYTCRLCLYLALMSEMVCSMFMFLLIVFDLIKLVYSGRSGGKNLWLEELRSHFGLRIYRCYLLSWMVLFASTSL